MPSGTVTQARYLLITTVRWALAVQHAQVLQSDDTIPVSNPDHSFDNDVENLQLFEIFFFLVLFEITF